MKLGSNVKLTEAVTVIITFQNLSPLAVNVHVNSEHYIIIEILSNKVSNSCLYTTTKSIFCLQHTILYLYYFTLFHPPFRMSKMTNENNLLMRAVI